ncbi:MAG TPA: primary-amine oxidase [Acidimicrobiales bacterium]
MVDVASTTAHPLDALAADEIRAAVSVVRESGRVDEAVLFSMVTLDEPSRDTVAAHRPGDPVERRVRLIVLPGPEAAVVEVVVSLASGQIIEWTPRPGVRPALLFDDSYRAILALRANPEWQKAMGRRGITDLEKVQIDPWPTGNFGNPLEEGRRVARCLSYYRQEPSDNGYARPVEGVLATVDAARGEVLEVLDIGVVPLPPGRGSYLPEDHEPLRRDLRPLDIVQPDGPSFSLDGNLLTWQHWSLRVSMEPLEGLVLRSIGYDDGGLRPILHRASICEMVVPYGDPGPMHGWKNAFDVGEWGLGRLANSLALGCDCLGEITYLDAVFSSEHGKPYVVENAVCIHEEDYGILWKHNDMNAGRSEVRRSRRLVVSSIATVGNYEYGFYWYFYLDGTIQLEVKLTGIMSTQALSPGELPEYGALVAPELAAPFHQHLFCARLDLAVDGPVNEAYEVSYETVPTGADNPWGNAFRQRSTRLESELGAQRDVDPASGRHWRFVNPGSVNGLGRPVAYKLVPGPTPTLLAQPDSSIGRRAGFARHNLWVTPYAPEQRRAAGDYPNQHVGGDGLPDWTAADRPLVGTELVAWHTFGVTHGPRPEDWPVMPVEYCGFHLLPVGFFDANPALDLPPSAGHCH